MAFVFLPGNRATAQGENGEMEPILLKLFNNGTMNTGVGRSVSNVRFVMNTGVTMGRRQRVNNAPLMFQIFGRGRGILILTLI